MIEPSHSDKSTDPPINLIGDLSDWSCADDACGIVDMCETCLRRERVAKLLAQRDLAKRPCTLDCTRERPCERCVEIDDYLRWLYLQRDQVAVLLRGLRQVAKVFPSELRELLAPVIVDVVAEVKP